MCVCVCASVAWAWLRRWGRPPGLPLSQGSLGLRGHHANDEKTSSSNEEDHSSFSSASLGPEASEDELDNDLEKSLLFQPHDLGSSEWHQSPLLHQ